MPQVHGTFADSMAGSAPPLPDAPAPVNAASSTPARRWLNGPTLVAGGVALALLLPALFFGPWLPFIDLVAFVGMGSYPAQQSYGPVHYATFQFTYIGHYALGRLLTDLHVSPPYQILLLYLMQVGVGFAVIWRALERLVANPWWRAVGTALGTLALWDGIFLWGGPLAYSLAATALSAATFLAFREAAEPGKSASLPIALLVLAALVCHPFALPFALVLCGVRFLFAPPQRRATVALALGVLVAGYVIVRDSPATEAGSVHGIGQLFGLHPAEMVDRLTGLFRLDALFAHALFGPPSPLLHGCFLAFAVLHLAGFLLSPWLAGQARLPTWLRMLATLNTAVGLMYLFSRDLPDGPIPEWPQRILTLYAPVTYLAGFAGIVQLIGRFRAPLVAPGWSPPKSAWLVPPALLLLAVAAQAPVLRLGDEVARNVAKVRSEVLASGVTNAYVVVAGVDGIRPFYLRCVPFMLFSDPELIARNVLVGTEWHFQARHPSRLVESTFNLGRKRYLAEFSVQASTLAVQLVEQPPNRFPLIEGTNLQRWGSAATLALGQFDQGVQLAQAGFLADAFEHFHTAAYLRPDFADAWSNAGVALQKAGRPQDAPQFFEAALKADAKHLDARLNLAMALATLGRNPEAIAHFEEVLRLKPDHAVAREWLARLKALPAGK